MKLLLFTVLLYCAVKCDDAGSNYYVIQMPEDVPVNKKPFKVYWNVPTMQCKSKKIPFGDLYKKYGIIQNEEDEFRGKEITIMYEPGLFPAIFKNETSGKYRFRNGGVPQEGSLEEHLKVFKKDMEEIVPDPNFSGLGIIDFESWRPVFRQNFGTLVPYKDVSIEIEKKIHWWWPKTWIQTEAQRRFEEAARTFMQTTLSIAKQMRPKAVWGYYGFPHCFNMASVSNMNETCPKNVISENDVTYWLWLESTALYPSVYSSRDLSSSQLGLLVRGRVEEAYRVRRYDTPIFPYFWFRYRDGGFMKEEDLAVVLQSLHKSNASGFIIWGSSNDVNTESKCQKLHEYVEKILGPTIAKYIQKINRLDDDQVDTTTESNINDFNDTTSIDNITNTTDNSIFNETIDNSNSNEFIRRVQFDPEFDWVPPENYSQDISRKVEDELLKKGYSSTGTKNIELKNLNESAVAGIIFDALLNSEYSKENNQQNTRDIQNGTTSTTRNQISSSKNIKSPKIENDVTEEPVELINKFSKTAIATSDILSSTPKFHLETFNNTQKESEKIHNALDVNTTIKASLISSTEGESIKTFTDGPYNKELINTENFTSNENNSVGKEFLKDNETNSQEIRFKNMYENMLMNLIFNSLMKHNIIDENHTKSVYMDLQNSDNTKTNIFTEKSKEEMDEIYFITTQKSIRVTRDDAIQSDSVKSLENLEIAKDIITDITNTTNSLITAKENEPIDLISSEDTLSNRDFKNLNTELDDFLIVLQKNTEPKSETTTEINIKQIDYDNNYLIILSNNINDTTNANATEDINNDDQNVDQSTLENLSVINVNDTLSSNSEESTINSQTESSTDIFETNSENNEQLKVNTDAVKNPKLNSETLNHDDQKTDKVLDVNIITEASLNFAKKTQFIPNYSEAPYIKEFTNTENLMPKENNLLSKYLLKDNQTNIDAIHLNNTNENMTLNHIFDALIKHNTVIENNNQSLYKDLENLDNMNSTEVTEKDGQNNEIYFATTIKSIREEYSIESDLETSLENLEIPKSIITDIISTTDTPITTKEDESFDLNSSDDTLSNKDIENLNTEIEDYLIVLKNYTEPKSVTVSQNNIKQIDYDNNYLIVLSVNMTNTTSDINDKDQSVDESTVESLSEKSVNDSLSNVDSEESIISGQNKSSTDDIFVLNSENSEHLTVTDVSEVSEFTTEPTVDQVVTFIYHI